MPHPPLAAPSQRKKPGLRDLPGPQSWVARYPLWAACRTDRDQPFIAHDWDTYWLWQYGQTNGRPFGVQSKFIDLNCLNNSTIQPFNN